MLAYFAGAVFEGFFSARISPNLVFVMLFSGVLARLLQLRALRSDDRVAYGDEGDAYHYGDEDEQAVDAAPIEPHDHGRDDQAGGRPAVLW